MSAKKKTKTKTGKLFPGEAPKAPFIIGIDASLSSTGIVRIDPQGKVVSSAAWECPLTGPARLAWLQDRLANLLDHVQVDAAVMEGYSHGSPYQREAMGELGGVLRLLLWRRSVPTLIVAPQTLRKFILPADAKQSGKAITMLHSFKRWGVEFGSDDECDAHALAQLGLIRVAIEAGQAKPGTPIRQVEAALTAAALISAPESNRVRRRS